MSKIKHGGLDQYGTGRFGRLILLQSENAGLKGLKDTTDDIFAGGSILIEERRRVQPCSGRAGGC